MIIWLERWPVRSAILVSLLPCARLTVTNVARKSCTRIGTRVLLDSKSSGRSMPASARCWRRTPGESIALRELKDAIAIGHERSPGLERCDDVGPERPCAWVVGLVDVESEHAALEIEIAPSKTERFALAESFASQQAIEHAVLQRDGLAREQLRLLSDNYFSPWTTTRFPHF